MLNKIPNIKNTNYSYYKNTLEHRIYVNSSLKNCLIEMTKFFFFK